MKQRDPLTLFVGIALIVFGILAVIGGFDILGVAANILGIVLIVVGILILVKVLPGGTLFGVIALVLGILLVGNYIGIGLTGQAKMVLNIVIGVVLIIMGIQRLR